MKRLEDFQWGGYTSYIQDIQVGEVFAIPFEEITLVYLVVAKFPCGALLIRKLCDNNRRLRFKVHGFPFYDGEEKRVKEGYLCFSIFKESKKYKIR